MKIYTRTGDDGTTGLYGGDRVPKTSARIQALGDVDELSAALGQARVSAQTSPDGWAVRDLEQIQCWLFDFGAELASPPGSKFAMARIQSSYAAYLEASIDEMTNQLEPLKNFILPGGSRLAAELHLARAICRRAERSVLNLDSEVPISEESKILLNRLSDWLFVAARTANVRDGVPDIAWHASEVV